MEAFIISFVISLFPIAIGAVTLGIIIYLIIQRVQEKENETFEDRNN
jgi:uncharacterized protein (DUF2062 family)